MVRVPAQKPLEFWLDRFEVTNGRFKGFVARGGYEKAVQGWCQEQLRSRIGLDAEPSECVQGCTDTPIRLSYNRRGVVGRWHRPLPRLPTPASWLGTPFTHG